MQVLTGSSGGALGLMGDDMPRRPKSRLGLRLVTPIPTAAAAAAVTPGGGGGLLDRSGL